MLKKLFLITSLISVVISAQSAHEQIPAALDRHGNFYQEVKGYGSVQSWLQNQQMDTAMMKLLADEIIPIRIRQEQKLLEVYVMDTFKSFFSIGILSFSIYGLITGYNKLHAATNYAERENALSLVIGSTVGGIISLLPAIDDIENMPNTITKIKKNRQTIAYLKELKQLLSDQIKLAH